MCMLMIQTFNVDSSCTVNPAQCQSCNIFILYINMCMCGKKLMGLRSKIYMAQMPKTLPHTFCITLADQRHHINYYWTVTRGQYYMPKIMCLPDKISDSRGYVISQHRGYQIYHRINCKNTFTLTSVIHALALLTATSGWGLLFLSLV